MKKNIDTFLLVLACICIGAASCAPAKPKQEAALSKEPEYLRVLCYNIHYANPPSRPGYIDLDAIAKVINTEDPDVVALQEVDVHVGRSGKINEAEILAEKTGMKAYFFAKAIDHDGGDYGVAILSKYDILESHNYPLPDDRSTNPEPRVLATARMKTPGGFEFVFASTHLEVRREENRRLQLEEIEKIAVSTGLPMVIAGDFNAKPESETISYLDKIFTRTCDDCPPTIPVVNPNRAIDFIAFRPKAAFKVLEHKVIQETYASDHLPVLAVLEINRKSSKEN
ncbi:endonuclease/exonuclease/phosphatase family protein [Anditalea andensis]|uniref:Endonuclease/exonuclease/phosphatase domain-containing protein n=1 Tax=Anditalea andensis TaxID=1048983 RepID=A0A074KTW6_9BACT|nr:endonuclease/exonuclease/phosphatase family protein [Anditalea andensis]KEO71690.1 hypothetical protein EL17_23325 [Anditalea andensis]